MVETFGESSCGAFFAHGCTCWHGVGLTAHVIESAKETETSGDGITFVKGSRPTYGDGNGLELRLAQ